MTMYELRTDDNPGALPLGTSTISRHRTLAAAELAREREDRRWRRSPYYSPGAWLPRLIVKVTSDGLESKT